MYIYIYTYYAHISISLIINRTSIISIRISNSIITSTSISCCTMRTSNIPIVSTPQQVNKPCAARARPPQSTTP